MKLPTFNVAVADILWHVRNVPSWFKVAVVDVDILWHTQVFPTWFKVAYAYIDILLVGCVEA